MVESLNADVSDGPLESTTANTAQTVVSLDVSDVYRDHDVVYRDHDVVYRDHDVVYRDHDVV